MSHPWLKPSITYLLPLAILGLALGVFFRALGISRIGPVTVEPQIAEIAVDPLQYEAVPVHLQLTNRTNKAIQIRKAETSCGCASLVTRGGQTLVEPLDVPSRGTVPWLVVIHTAGRIGPSEFKVYFEIVSGGRVSHAISTIKMNILPAISINPRSIDFGRMKPREERAAKVLLSDAYPDAGYCVSKVNVSDPERLQVKIVPAEKITPTCVADSTKPAVNFRPRWCIHLDYLAPLAPRALVGDEIVLVPKDEMHPQISLPVTCTMVPPPYAISPETLVLPADCLGQTLTRTIRCRLHRSVDPALQVISAPKSVKVNIVPLGARIAELHVTINVPHRLTDASAIKPIRIGYGAGPSMAFTIPLEFLGPN